MQTVSFESMHVQKSMHIARRDGKNGSQAELPGDDVEYATETLPNDTFNALVLYENLCRMNIFILETVGFSHRGASVFDPQSHAIRSSMDNLKLTKQYNTVCQAYHWQCHRTPKSMDFVYAYEAMGDIIDKISSHGANRDNCSCTLLPVFHSACGYTDAPSACVRVVVTVTHFSRRQTIPMAPVSHLIGRQKEIAAIVKLLEASNAPRVLIYGPSGVGKDVVVSEVLRHPRIGYGKWSLCSTCVDGCPEIHVVLAYPDLNLAVKT